MSTLTIAPTAASAATAEAPSASPGLIARLIERTTAAQTIRARVIVYRHLATYTDARLAELGFKSAEIAEIRKFGGKAMTD